MFIALKLSKGLRNNSFVFVFTKISLKPNLSTAQFYQALYKTHIFFVFEDTKSKCISRNSRLMPTLRTILNCFALEHSAFKTKHLKMS